MINAIIDIVGSYSHFDAADWGDTGEVSADSVRDWNALSALSAGDTRSHRCDYHLRNIKLLELSKNCRICGFWNPKFYPQCVSSEVSGLTKTPPYRTAKPGAIYEDAKTRTETRVQKSLEIKQHKKCSLQVVCIGINYHQKKIQTNQFNFLGVVSQNPIFGAFI